MSSALETDRRTGHDLGYAEEQSRTQGVSKSAQIEREQAQEHGMDPTAGA